MSTTGRSRRAEPETRQVTIVMYHYVRDLARSRYPAIKGLDLAQFRAQLAFLKEQYTVVTMEDLLASIEDSTLQFPPNAALLTFDDAYIDHYTNVFPLLDEAGLQGSFFAPVRAVKEHRLLDVNKLHFTLAAAPDIHCLLQDIWQMLDDHRFEYKLQEDQYYWSKLAVAGRFDPPEIIFIKRLLQRELPEALRNIVTSALFEKYVSVDEEAFARELYMSTDQLRCMRRHGMHIGAHGHDHYWWDRLSLEGQVREVDTSLSFLRDLGCDMEQIVVSYPYGAWNEPLLGVLRERGVKAGVTTEAAIATLDNRDPLLLPRLDTNDLPKG